MKKGIILLALLLLLGACGRAPAADQQPTKKPQATTAPQEEKAMKLTKEYLIEHSALTEDDLAGVDIDAFAAYFELTPENLDQYDASALLRMYKESLEEPERIDYTPLFAAASGVLTEEDFADIRVLAWEYHEGTYNAAMVIDRDRGAVYYGVGLFLDRVEESSRLADWKEDDLGFLAEALRESGICSWQNEYRGTSEGTTGHFAWAIAAKLDSGRCVSYSGEGVLNSGTPKSLRPLLEKLEAHFSA